MGRRKEGGEEREEGEGGREGVELERERERGRGRGGEGALDWEPGCSWYWELDWEEWKVPLIPVLGRS